MSPFLFTLLASAVISLGFSLVYRIFGDQAEMRELKKDLKKYRVQMKEHRGNPDKVKELTTKVEELRERQIKTGEAAALVCSIFRKSELQRSILGRLRLVSQKKAEREANKTYKEAMAYYNKNIR